MLIVRSWLKMSTYRNELSMICLAEMTRETNTDVFHNSHYVLEFPSCLLTDERFETSSDKHVFVVYNLANSYLSKRKFQL